MTDNALDRDALDQDVIVIGFGPVGSTLSALLARRGLRVLAVDRDTEIYPLPRAVHLDQEIMRVVQEVGCADELSLATIENPGMDFLTADRQVLLSMRPEADTPSGWPASMFFFQPDLELRLRQRAVELGTVTRLGVAAEEVIDHGDHVEVRLADGSAVRATYAVGCDGARSTVRKQLGVEMHDLEFEEPWLVVDLVLRDGATPPSALTLQVCDPARPTTLVPMPPPRFRFEFMLVEGDDAVEIQSPERVRAMVAPWMDPDDAAVERAAVYTFHGLIATSWRKGRVLLAGDAAHMTPPFLGQGMCAGIRDAANLAWKLERVVRGTSPSALLDTYQRERAPHVQQLVGAAVSFGRLICTTDRDVAAQRDTDLLAARAAGAGTIGTATMPPLEPGALVAEGGGTQVYQPTVDGRRLDDVVGDRFAIITRTTALAQSEGAQWWTARGAVALDADSTPAVAAALDALAADAAVVRPDRYVLFAGDSVPVPGPATFELLAV
jgi:3-(3-hydroxy-phenyl)propionate hydroxylase